MPANFVVDPIALAFAALALLAGTTLQSAIGFGSGLLTIPLLVMLGFGLPHAVATLVGGALTQVVIALYGVRQHVQPRLAIHVGVTQWIGIPLGVAAMALLAQTDPSTVRRGIGIVVIVLVTLHVVAKPTPRPELARPWAWLAGGSAGLLAGLVGMGGPPLVLYGLANDWSNDQFRAFLWAQFLIAFPIMLAVMTWRFGTEILPFVGMGLVCTPIAWAGTKLGLALTQRWPAQRMRLAATIVLYAIGIFGVLG